MFNVMMGYRLPSARYWYSWAQTLFGLASLAQAFFPENAEKGAKMFARAEKAEAKGNVLQERFERGMRWHGAKGRLY